MRLAICVCGHGYTTLFYRFTRVFQDRCRSTAALSNFRMLSSAWLRIARCFAEALAFAWHVSLHQRRYSVGMSRATRSASPACIALSNTHFRQSARPRLQVQPKDIPGHPFKCCRAPDDRLTILMCRNEDVAVLFQRYTDDANTWAFASKTLPIGGCRLSQSMAARLALSFAYDYADFE